MPRGVYDRSKSKSTKGGDAATSKPAPVHKKMQVKSTKTGVQQAVKAEKTGPSYSRAAEASFAFQILGTNLTTLVSVLKELGDTTVELKTLGISQEIKETLDTISSLRREIFGEVRPVSVSPVKTHAAEYVDVKQTTPVTMTESPAPATTLPQGNAAFTPPAPPALPHH